MTSARLKVNCVPYRKGFIEVSTGIHEDCINLETWDIKPGTDISNLDFGSTNLPDSAFQGNTELELDISTAEALVEALQNAIATVRKGAVA